MPKSFRIDPDARKDYVFDWAAWLGADTIASYTLTAAGDVELDGNSGTDTAVTGWVRPVPPAVSGSVTCHVVTAAGREDDRTMQFFVGEE